MTYFTDTHVRPDGFRRISPLERLIRADRVYRERQHMLALSDEMLEDVGLKRSDLHRA